MSVTARIEPRVIPTYPVGKPEKNPVFFEKRVYQGSSGKVYPVPFIDKVFDVPHDVTYQSVRLENEFVRLVMLPEIGGRIFLGQDKTNADYDFFYRQDVIKPALVGLAGPWISGGVEFNWPQHHRPGTFMPADVFIEEEEDGARTVWMSEHDPLNRLKGMHGIRLRPGSSLIELRARLYNRTPLTQTFLWWANVAAMVHEQYQSFFPPDVTYVADHAVRAMSSFPIAQNPYYGVDYQNRPGTNDLSWYRNIPVPTSYMVCQTQFDFFGGYDFKAGGGFVHVANRHIAPGKKQWTWGDHGFGHAWDRELTDSNGPYIELMAGVYTDNQPDFSYLAPYETKTFSQFWWPIQGIGPVQQANDLAALRMVVRDDRTIELGLCVSASLPGLTLRVMCDSNVLLEEIITLAPGTAWKNESLKFTGENPASLSAILLDEDGQRLLAYRPVDETKLTRTRELATEPPAPADISSNDELYFTGEHLELYRHPTRMPEAYWGEALRRDAGDVRSQIALGRRKLRKGLFTDAETHFRKAIARLTRRHPNPETGEAHYFLGVSLVFKDRHEDAYSAFYKATWNYTWRGAAYYQLACIDCRRLDFETANQHLDESLATLGDHNKAIVLQAIIANQTGDTGTATGMLEDILAADPLDHFAAVAAGFMTERGLQSASIPPASRNDAQTILDISFDFIDAGFHTEAIALLDAHHKAPVTPVAVPNPLERTAMTQYLRAWLSRDPADLAAARRQSPDYFFPSRLHEQLVLEWALEQPGSDPVACFALGNYYYDLKRHEDAIAVWQRAVDDGADFATVHRNLGIALWNVRRHGEAARACYQKALELDIADPRLVSEYDQLRAKLNDPLADRLAFLETHIDRVMQRDDCTVALAGLHNLTGRPGKALELVTSRRFHPWEGGEGAVLRQFTTAHLLLGRKALDNGDAATALDHFTGAMQTPESLGEAYHLLQAKADVNYWIGRALKASGRLAEAEDHFKRSAGESGDFSEMAVTAHSPLTYFRGLSLRELGHEDQAKVVFEDLKAYATAKLGETAAIDYFATSLPNLLVFEEDLQARRNAENHLLIALACHGLGDIAGAQSHLAQTLAFTNSDQRAADLAAALRER
jgi:tetratricopeptide (TPR) repeat protein